MGLLESINTLERRVQIQAFPVQSEVPTGKRELSMSMVRKLRERFHICRGFADFAGTAPGASSATMKAIDRRDLGALMPQLAAD
jgi:hypothetical protein